MHMEISNRQALLKQRKIVEKAVGDYARKVNRARSEKVAFLLRCFIFVLSSGSLSFPVFII